MFSFSCNSCLQINTIIKKEREMVREGKAKYGDHIRK